MHMQLTWLGCKKATPPHPLIVFITLLFVYLFDLNLTSMLHISATLNWLLTLALNLLSAFAIVHLVAQHVIGCLNWLVSIRSPLWLHTNFLSFHLTWHLPDKIIFFFFSSIFFFFPYSFFLHSHKEYIPLCCLENIKRWQKDSLVNHKTICFTIKQKCLRVDVFKHIFSSIILAS